MTVQIKLKDGSIISPEEHYQILCKEHGLSGTKHIKRDPNNRERWIEDDTKYEVLSPKTAEEVKEEALWPSWLTDE